MNPSPQPLGLDAEELNMFSEVGEREDFISNMQAVTNNNRDLFRLRRVTLLEVRR